MSYALYHVIYSVYHNNLSRSRVYIIHLYNFKAVCFPCPQFHHRLLFAIVPALSFLGIEFHKILKKSELVNHTVLQNYKRCVHVILFRNNIDRIFISHMLSERLTFYGEFAKYFCARLFATRNSGYATKVPTL